MSATVLQLHRGAGSSVTPPPVTPSASGSGYATLTVHADAFALGPSVELSGSVNVTLEREYSSSTGGSVATRLTIAEGAAIANESEEGYRVAMLLRSPDALHALVRALLQLADDPHGVEILASIGTTSGDAGDDSSAGDEDNAG
jgi:hypothetical protein